MRPLGLFSEDLKLLHFTEREMSQLDMKGVEVLISFHFAFVQLKLTPTDRATKQLMITFDACDEGFKEIKDIALEN